jgi:hypothetical protein
MCDSSRREENHISVWYLVGVLGQISYLTQYAASVMSIIIQGSENVCFALNYSVRNSHLFLFLNDEDYSPSLFMFGYSLQRFLQVAVAVSFRNAFPAVNIAWLIIEKITFWRIWMHCHVFRLFTSSLDYMGKFFFLRWYHAGVSFKYLFVSAWNLISSELVGSICVCWKSTYHVLSLIL